MSSDFKQTLVELAKTKPKEGKLVIISGMSGAGKTVMAEILENKYNYAFIDKYVTRPFRKVELDALNNGQRIGIKPVFGKYNDGEKEKEEQKRLNSQRKQAFLNLRLPLAYINYGNYYGFSIDEINNYIEHGRDAVIIVNDIGLTKDLKNIYEGQCVSCYVHRAITKNKEIFMEIARQRGDTEESAEKRYKQAVKDFERYINNIELYDYTILNTENGFEKLSKMMEDLNSREFKHVQKEKKQKQGKAKIYLFTGNPGSGKDDALETIRVQGILHSIIVPKHTTRARKEDDGEEMICPEDNGFNMEECDIQYTNYGSTYGINTEDITQRLKDGISSSIVVSNKGAIEELERKFPEEVVKIYIQGLSKEEYILQQKDYLEEEYVRNRIEEYEMADELYYDQWLDFDHVIINNGDLVDLKVQIDTIQRYYEEGRDLSVQEFKKYMNKVDKYIAKFAKEYQPQARGKE